MRGEYQPAGQVELWQYGSPPRAWGIPDCQSRRQFGYRFTPTCVGNTYSRSFYLIPASVHPHVRGEYASIHLNWSGLGGSPPRAWGIPYNLVAYPELVRFTPTCVGNTRRRRSVPGRPSVHPHVRGEYLTAEGEMSSEVGSPPRAWGIRTPLRIAHAGQQVHPHVRGEYGGGWVYIWDELRFPPTCVGNTPGVWLAPAQQPVHPHVRGEYRQFWS